MKKTVAITSFLLSIFLLAPLFFLNNPAVKAAEYRVTEDNPIIDELIQDNLYISGNKVEINEDVMGDVFATGGTIIIKDDIYGDVYAAAGLITINGNIEGDLVATGGKIILNGDVSEDITIAGGMIELNGDVADDGRIAGGQVDIGEITIGGDLLVRAGSGQISKDLVVGKDKDIEIGDTAKTSFDGFDFLVPFGNTGSLFIHILRNIGVLIGWLIVGWLIFKFAPIKSKVVVDLIADRAMMLKSILTGCGVFVVLTISIPLLIILFVLGIGQPILQLGLSLFGLGITIGGIYASTALAKVALKSIRGKNYDNIIIPMIIGVTVYQVLGWIPCCLGLIIKIVITTWGIGGILLVKYKAVKATSPKKKMSK